MTKFSSRHFVQQHDAMQCGIACLAMICRFCGKAFTLDYLASLCQVTAQGCSLAGISDAAHVLHLDTLTGRVSLSQLKDVPLPCILHWNQNHFVVLYKVKRGTYYIADPGKGLTRYSEEEFARHWLSMQTEGEDKGIAMFLEPKPEFFSQRVEPPRGKRTFRFLAGYLSRYRRHFVLIFLGLLLGCVLQLLMPFLTQGIVDLGIRHRDVGLIWLILIGELMIIVGRTATDFVRRWLLLHISMRINISLVSDFFIKLLKLPMAFFDTQLMGDLLQRIGDHSRIQSFLTTQVLSVMFTMLSFLVFGVVLLVYDKLIFAVFLLGSVVYGLWIAHFLNRRKVLDYELFQCQANNQNKTYQFITTMQEIKLQGCERRRRWEWEDAQADLFDVQLKALKLQQTQEAGSIFINELKNILITVLAATAVINGQITLGAMLAVQYIVGQLNSPVEQLMAFIYSLQDVKISLERINEIHLSSNEEDDRRQLRAFAAPKEIELQRVCFKYNRHAPDLTISDVSFSIPHGKVTAIIGSSGSGKTTLIKLMLGYYRLTSGAILLAGHNLSAYSLSWWRSHCGVVMQDGALFSESIARNIAVDDREIDIARLRLAARIACIDTYVETLPLRYDTRIGPDGMGISQGQKQRILIARAVYKNPDFIFLDEATNSLDATNERMIVENLSRFYQGKTVVVVAHRLSTVRDADQIIVLDKGHVAEVGTHQQLIAKHGAYYNLVKNQLELGA